MSVVVTGYEQVAVQVGVFCRPGGLTAAPSGWPFGRFTFGAVGCSLTATSPSRSRQNRRTFAWADVIGAESTRFGVRFRFADLTRPVEISTLRHEERLRLLEAARTYCPVGTFEDNTDQDRADQDEAAKTNRVTTQAAVARKMRRRQPEQT